MAVEWAYVGPWRGLRAFVKGEDVDWDDVLWVRSVQQVAGMDLCGTTMVYAEIPPELDDIMGAMSDAGMVFFEPGELDG